MDDAQLRFFVKKCKNKRIIEKIKEGLIDTSNEKQINKVLILCVEYCKHRAFIKILKTYTNTITIDEILDGTTYSPNIGTSKWLIKYHSKEIKRNKLIEYYMNKSRLRSIEKKYLECYFPSDNIKNVQSLLRMYIKYNDNFDYAFKVNMYDHKLLEIYSNNDCIRIIKNLKSGNQLLLMYDKTYKNRYISACGKLSRIYNTWDKVLPLMKIISPYIETHRRHLLRQGIEIVKILKKCGLTDIYINLILSYCFIIVRKPLPNLISHSLRYLPI